MTMYDLFTGKCGKYFWDPVTIDVSNTMAVPSPIDPKRKVSDIHTSYVSLPVRCVLILFQTKSCLGPCHYRLRQGQPRQGDFAIAPLIFTF